MKVKTNVRVGRIAFNHNQTATGLKVASKIRVGRIALNHNQTVAR